MSAFAPTVRTDQRAAVRRHGQRHAADRLGARPRRAPAHRQRRRPVPSDRPARPARERRRESSHALRYPRSAIATTVAPGSTADALVHLPPRRRRPATTRSTTPASTSTTAARPATAACSRRSTHRAPGRPPAPGPSRRASRRPTPRRPPRPWLQRVRHPLRRGARDHRHGSRVLHRHRRCGRHGHGAPAQPESAHRQRPAGPDPGPRRRPAHDLRARPGFDRRVGRGLERHVHRRPDRPGGARDRSSTPPDQPRPAHDATSPRPRTPRRTRAGRSAAAEYFVDPVGRPAPGHGHRARAQRQPGNRGTRRRRPAREPRRRSPHNPRRGAGRPRQLGRERLDPARDRPRRARHDSVAVSPNPNNGTLGQDGYPGVVWVTATITDGGPNPSAVKAAEGFIDPTGTPDVHTGWTMMAVDGVLDAVRRAGLRSDPAERDRPPQRRQPRVRGPRAGRRRQLGRPGYGHAPDRQDRARDHGGGAHVVHGRARRHGQAQRHGRRRLAGRPLRVLPRPGARNHGERHTRDAGLDQQPGDHDAVQRNRRPALRVRAGARPRGQLGPVDAAPADGHQPARAIRGDGRPRARSRPRSSHRSSRSPAHGSPFRRPAAHTSSRSRRRPRAPSGRASPSRRTASGSAARRRS